MATKHYIKTVKTGYWKGAKTEAYATIAQQSYLKISKRGTKI